jgi:hypothetical protein
MGYLSCYFLLLTGQGPFADGSLRATEDSSNPDQAMKCGSLGSPSCYSLLLTGGWQAPELRIKRIKRVNPGALPPSGDPFKALPAPYIGHALDRPSQTQVNRPSISPCSGEEPLDGGEGRRGRASKIRNSFLGQYLRVRP